MSSLDRIHINNLNNTIIHIYRYAIPILCILGNVGNLASVLIFFKKTWRKNVCVFYFTICLFFNTGYINFYMIATMFITGFNITVHNSNLVLCKLYFYVGFFFSTMLPMILILASIDRLLISSQNIDTRLYSSRRLAYFSISISTFFWFVFFFHVLVKANLYKPYLVSYCYFDTSNNYIDFLSYSSLVINFLVCLLMIVLSILAIKNVRRIRAIPRQQRRQVRSMTKKDFQLLRCLFVQDIVYIMFSILPNVYSVYQAATANRTQTSLEQAINSFLLNFLLFLHDIPYCVSFFIFVLVSKAFRTELKRIIYQIFGRDLIVVREEENRQENVEKDNVEQNIVVVNTIVPQV